MNSFVCSVHNRCFVTFAYVFFAILFLCLLLHFFAFGVLVFRHFSFRCFDFSREQTCLCSGFTHNRCFVTFCLRALQYPVSVLAASSFFISTFCSFVVIFALLIFLDFFVFVDVAPPFFTVMHAWRIFCNLTSYLFLPLSGAFMTAWIWCLATVRHFW